MCGRYTLRSTPQKLSTLFDVLDLPAVEPRHNIAPTQSVLVVRQQPGEAHRRGVWMRWGLQPRWAKEGPKAQQPLFNARSETVSQRPAFRDAFRRRRCLIPADGFYEWKVIGPRRKQPYLIERKDHEPLAFAGLWEPGMNEQGQAADCCTMLTTQADDVVRELHDRMPVILEPEAWKLWLSAEAPLGALQLLLAPAKQSPLVTQAVDTRINRAGVDQAPEPVNPLPAEKPRQTQANLFEDAE